MLSDQEISQYRENGFIIPDFRLSEETLAEIRGHHDRLVARRPEFADYCPHVLAFDLSFLNYARSPAIVDMVEQLIGPDLALWNSSFFAKPAKNGRRTPWHQDGEYWPIRPVATCTVWLAIDPSMRENGCLQVLRGSHKDRTLHHHNTSTATDVTLNLELGADQIDEAKVVDLELEAGQMSLHDVFLFHGSEANRSAQPRRGMTLRYMPTTSVFNRDLAKQQAIDLGLPIDHSERTLFLLRGTDQSGGNDFRLRW